MRNFDIPEEIYSDILKSKAWQNQGVTVKQEKLAESAEVEAEEVIEEEEEFHCPLCESKLQEAISQEKIDAHVDFLAEQIKEAFGEDTDLEDLDESEDESESEED